MKIEWTRQFNQYNQEAILMPLQLNAVSKGKPLLISTSDELHEIFIRSASRNYLAVLIYLMDFGLALPKGNLFTKAVTLFKKNNLMVNLEICGQDALKEACYRGHIKVVQFLLEKGVVDTKQCLVGASYSGNLELVKLLIEFKWEHKLPEYSKSDIDLALKTSISLNYVSISLYLMSFTLSYENKVSFLISSARLGDEEVFSAVFETNCGRIVDNQLVWGAPYLNCLAEALINNQYSIVQFLIEKNILILKDVPKWLLEFIIVNSQIEILSTLCIKGLEIDLNKINAEFLTQLRKSQLQKALFLESVLDVTSSPHYNPLSLVNAILTFRESLPYYQNLCRKTDSKMTSATIIVSTATNKFKSVVLEGGLQRGSLCISGTDSKLADTDEQTQSSEYSDQDLSTQSLSPSNS